MCAKTLAKIFLVVFNIIFFLFGALLLGVGIFVLVDDGTIQKVMARVPTNDVFTSEDLDDIVSKKSYLEMSAIILISSGAFLFIVGFCGCCGALKENKCLLGIYAGIVIFIVLIEVAAVTIGFIFYDRFEEYATDYMLSTIELKYVGMSVDNSGTVVVNEELFSLAWDMSMFYFKCCGVWNSSDFLSADEWNKTVTVSGSTFDMVVPPSCCKVTNKNKFPDKVDELNFVDLNDCITTGSSTSTHTRGCYPELKDWLEKYSLIMAGVGCGILVLEVIGILCACHLIKSRNKVDKF